MESLRELFKIGTGPSSSHTMGPERACKKILELFPNCKKFKVILYGSLSLTGYGHGTDIVIKKILGDDTEIIFDNTTITNHPNTFDILGFDINTLIFNKRIISVGGGKILFENEDFIKPVKIYPHKSFEEIKNYCLINNKRLYEYVYEFEPDIKNYLLAIWTQMQETIKEGLQKTGTLPGGLNVQRKAHILYSINGDDINNSANRQRLVSAYAFASSEQNASQSVVVTCPTCGSCGVLPAVLYYFKHYNNLSDEQVVNALATSGLIGNVIKANASLSGAECGCQAEIGSACSMASAALGEIKNMTLDEIEYAAEVSLEHLLGLTCDPVKGLVQIPCIERNAMAAMHAIDSVVIAQFLTDTRKISLDVVIKTMYETGNDLLSNYKETSQAGLAKIYKC